MSIEVSVPSASYVKMLLNFKSNQLWLVLQKEEV